MRCVNSSSYILRVIEELAQVIPVAFPGGLNHRIFVIPLFAESFQSFVSAFCINCRINFFQITAGCLKVFVRNKLRRITDHMDNSVLNVSVRKDGFHGIRKSCKSVHAGNEDVLSSTPRFFMSVRTLMRLRRALQGHYFTVRSRGLHVQNFAPSVSASQSPKTSFLPSQLIARAT